jgi:hypothetical protein
MRDCLSNDIVKIRMMAAQMRHHALATTWPDYAAKFERAAAELERKAEEVDRHGRAAPARRRLDS